MWQVTEHLTSGLFGRKVGRGVSRAPRRKAKCKRRREILKERQTPEVGKRRAFGCRAGAADARQDEEMRKTKREALRQVKSKVVKS